MGAFLASFASLVAWRLPRGQSIAAPPSFCPACKNRIAWYDLIPVLSYLVLRGRCRKCEAKIPVRELVVETIGAGSALLLGLNWGLTPTALVYGLFAYGLLAVALVDLERLEVPLSIVVALFVLWSLAFGYHMLHGWVALPHHPFAGVLVMLALSGLATLISRGRYGGGDWLVGGLMGLFLGATFGLVAWVFANGLALPFAAARSFRSKERKPVPFVPALAVATFIFSLPEVQLFWVHLFPYVLPV